MNFGKNRTAEKSDDPIGQAIDLARKAIDVHSRGQQRIARLQVELNSAIESESAGAVEALEAGTEVPAVGKAANLAMQIEILKRACDVARSKALEAITEIYRCAAQAERGRAEEKRTRRAEILEAVRKPLAELSRLEGIEYSPFILKSQPQGVWEKRFGQDPPDFETCGPADCVSRGGVANPQPYATPLSEKLVHEIEAHEKLAAELAERQVDASGDLAAVLETVVREVTPAPAVTAGVAA